MAAVVAMVVMVMVMAMAMAMPITIVMAMVLYAMPMCADTPGTRPAKSWLAGQLKALWQLCVYVCVSAVCSLQFVHVLALIVSLLWSCVIYV